jgi:diguanylate cyclase
VALRDVAQRSLRTLAELTGRPDRQLTRRCLDQLGRDMREIVSQSEHMTQQLRHSEERIAQLETFLDSARQDASTDGLTGIANRRACDAVLRDRAGHAMNEGTGLGFVLVDVDRFKLVNDRWGHAVGDDVLRMIAGTLVRHVRSSDVVARYGGEEFAVILPGTGEQGALAAAEHLRMAVERETLLLGSEEQESLRVTISAGVACYDPGETLGAWLNRADAALYRAKKGGRNRVAFGGIGASLPLANANKRRLSRAG